MFSLQLLRREWVLTSSHLRRQRRRQWDSPLNERWPQSLSQRLQPPSPHQQPRVEAVHSIAATCVHEFMKSRKTTQRQRKQVPSKQRFVSLWECYRSKRKYRNIRVFFKSCYFTNFTEKYHCFNLIYCILSVLTSFFHKKCGTII